MKQKNAALRLFDAAKYKLVGIHFLRSLLMCTLVFGAQYAMAAGGFDQGTDILEKIRDTIYTLVGIVATIALLWQFALGFMNKKEWPDVMGTCLWILGAGAAVAFATYLFTSGGKMKFN